MGVAGLRRLQVWSRAKDFALKIYKQVLPLLPAEEKWALGQQLRRASVSVPANIAEGHGRFYYQDNVRFCYTARGSLEETLSHLVFAMEAGYIPQALFEQLEHEGEEIEKMLHGYISHLRRSKQGWNEPGLARIVGEEPASYSPPMIEDEIDNGP